MFTFPLETITAHVKLRTTKQDFNAVTVCERSFTDLERSHLLFSLATPESAWWPGCSTRDPAGPSPNQRREAIPQWAHHLQGEP
ncbi:hypothetical protein CRENBAI_002894 [Crenichthys baileyi]|uniref:Pentraxin (PTX) domain-containing protein n=1 Tax=Crenichthys baileyi TaxID=28760 RepID=A0AAV9QSY5_9TELE